MPKRSVDLETNIDGDPKGFNNATRSATEHARRLERENARLEKRLKTLGDQMKRSGKSASLMRGELVTLAAAGAAVAPAFVASGAGVVAFAALAAPSILRVVKAQEDLVANWDSLTDAEKVSAAGLRGLISQYKALARSLEPETLGLFNQALGVTSRQMPKLASIARAVSDELGHFVDNLERAIDGPEGQEFTRFLQEASGPATRQIGETLGSAAGAATELLQALGPVSGVGLKVVGMLLDMVGAVSDVAPGLVQVAVLAVALRGPLGGLGDMLGTAGGKLTAFGDGATGARAKAGGLGKVLTGMGAILSGPWGIAVTAAIALLGAFAASKADAAAQIAEFEAAIRQDSGALGQATRALTTHKLEEEGLLELAQRNGVSMSAYTDAILGNKDAHAQVTKVIDDKIAAMKAEYEAGRWSFENYRAGVEPLIDLRAALRGKNETINEAVDSYKRLRDAQQAGVAPTDAIKVAWEIAGKEGEDLKLRVDALAAAFEAYFNPALAVLGATNRMKDAVKESNEVLKDSKATGQDRRKALESQLGVLRDWAQAEFRSTQNVKNSSAAMLEQLPALVKLAGGSREGKAAIDAFVGAMGGTITRAHGAVIAVDKFGNQVKILPSGKVVRVDAATKKASTDLDRVKNKHAALQGRTATVTVKANTAPAFFSFEAMIARIGARSVSIPVGIRAAGATGGLVTPAGIVPRLAGGGGPVRGPGTATSDSIPALLSDGEYVINAAAVRRHRTLIEAINAGRFAGGGLVGRYADGGPIGDVNVPISDFIGRFVGTTATRADVTSAARSRKDAVDQLRKAERKLAEDRRRHRSARTIADDEARVRKERRDLAVATNRLATAEARYRKSRLTPLAKLQGGLALGIKNTGAFIKNITTIADRGFPELAQQLLAMGGPEAEKLAADAARLSASKLRGLNNQVRTAARQQSRLAALPDILAIKAARKAGVGGSIAELTRATGLTEEQIRAAYTAMGYARGGIITGPGSGTSDSVPAMLSRGEYVVNARATAQHRQLLDAINTGRAAPAVAASGGGVVRVVLDARGADADMLRMLRRMVKIEGRGNVQIAFGNAKAS